MVRTARTCNNLMKYDELGRFPLYIDIQTREISYWCKLLTGKASKLSAIFYKLLHSFFYNGNISAPWGKFEKIHWIIVAYQMYGHFRIYTLILSG